MPEKKHLKAFRQATLKELIAEPKRLREQAEALGKKMADLAIVINERKDEADRTPRK
jgi:hypothetical protein